MSGLFQQQRNTIGTATVPAGDYNSWALDFGGKYDIAGFEAAGWYYVGKGVGTTGLFVNSNDAAGDPRDSNGFLIQATYKVMATKFGINYGQSVLKAAGGDVGIVRDDLVRKNDKITVGVYQDLTTNLMLLFEVSRIASLNQAGQENTSRNANIGAFLKF
jgi:hypothetical protein